MMLQEETISKEEQLIEQMADITLDKHPALEGLIKPFSSIFKAKARLMEELKQESIRINLSAGPLASETPSLMGIDFEPLRKPLEQAAESMSGALSMAFPELSQQISDISGEVKAGRIDFVLLARNYLESASRGFDSVAQPAGLSPDCLDLVVRLSLSAVLEALVPPASSELEQTYKGKGYCPVCGFPPSISYLDRVPESQSEFLKGGGGQKYLHCSLCGHNWRILRHTCPACGTDEPEDRVYFQVDDAGERVDVCQNCNVYLPCIDLRVAGSLHHLEVSAVGMVYLDVMAQGKGFKPMSATPWNRLG